MHQILHLHIHDECNSQETISEVEDSTCLVSLEGYLPRTPSRSPESRSDALNKGLFVPLETCYLAAELSLILAGNSSPVLSLSFFLITFDFSSEEYSFLWSYFYWNFNESLGMTLITEDLKCLQIVFSFLLNASHTFLFTVKC